MKYMLLLFGDRAAGPVPGSPEFGRMLQEYGAATDAMREAGVLLDTNPLQPESTATTVRVRDGERQLTDGPYAEIKEMLGGYFLVDCPTLDDAVKWAAMIPAAKYGSVEIRPIMEMEGPPA
jgi:hypothetical protein